MLSQRLGGTRRYSIMDLKRPSDDQEGGTSAKYNRYDRHPTPQSSPHHHIERAKDVEMTPMQDVLTTQSPGAFADISSPLEVADAKQLMRKAEKLRKEEEKRLDRERRENERKAAKERKEAEKVSAKLRKEAARKAERDQKEAEKRAEKERKEAEKRAEKERKEAEKELREAEKRAEKDRKESEKRAAKLKFDTSQRSINSFFTTKPSASVQSSITTESDCFDTESTKVSNETDAQVKTDFEQRFLPWEPKLSSESFVNFPQKFLCEDLSTWRTDFETNCGNLDGHPVKTLSTTEFKAALTAATSPDSIRGLLKRIEPRYIEFWENRRPPFIGTVVDVSSEVRRQLSLEPWRTDLIPGVTYDYDSDVEGDTDDEGEDLDGDSDGAEDDDGMDSDASLDGFVDSDEEVKQQRAVVVEPITPIVQWNPDNGLASLPVEWLAEPFDPFTTEHSSQPITSGGAAEPDMARDLKIALLKQIQGSEGTQLFLVELLKQQFPDLAKSTILQTVKACAIRTDKKWTLHPEIVAQYGITTS